MFSFNGELVNQKETAVPTFAKKTWKMNGHAVTNKVAGDKEAERRRRRDGAFKITHNLNHVPELMSRDKGTNV